jgi:hypothetical protein
MNNLVLPFAVAMGIAIAYIDSRPSWDDAGITALAIFVTCAVCGALWPTRPWLCALAVGAWIPLFGIATAGNFGSLLVLVFAFPGAYAGRACRKALLHA